MLLVCLHRRDSRKRFQRKLKWEEQNFKPYITELSVCVYSNFTRCIFSKGFPVSHKTFPFCYLKSLKKCKEGERNNPSPVWPCPSDRDPAAAISSQPSPCYHSSRRRRRLPPCPSPPAPSPPQLHRCGRGTRGSPSTPRRRRTPPSSRWARTP